MTTSPAHYVDNKRFQVLLVDRKAEYDKLGSPPRVVDELGSMIMMISENLAYRRNFINYSFRDEMVGDGIENCLRYIDRYDTVNYSNPFAYFTQTCFFAFIRRIKREDRQSMAKNAIYEKQLMSQMSTDKWDFQNSVVDDYMRSMVDVVGVDLTES